VEADARFCDAGLEAEVAAARRRYTSVLLGREATGRMLMVALFLAVAVPLAAAPTHRAPGWWLYLALLVGYAALTSISFELGRGLAVPTELVLVPMLFLLPAGQVPLVVAGGLLTASVPQVVRGQLRAARALAVPANALFSVGPALVFVVAGEPGANARGGTILVAAVAAQFAADFAAASLLEWTALGVSPRRLVRPLATTFAIDALIAPIGFLVAIGARLEPFALALPMPVFGLLWWAARERRERLDSTIELSAAYRGTAFLLGDVVEAGDAYTGDHSRQVVELVTGVCDSLRLGARETRLAEFAALLHDVGKIRVPAEIINKPGPLTDHEWAVIRRHTIDGEELLCRVGGLLAEVGAVIRSCHERWDGGGYPDGLAGERIPLVARIVCCCDAYNAMTTDRSYRSALTIEAALDELLANRGTQFDPVVVDALVAVIRARLADTTAAVTRDRRRGLAVAASL
jgi:HD-GYP domain-containing protein (c-di-GMP phosphodiesterase class II)